ncbi:hypothetical protein D3Z51_11865 [Clostridiaceae bacterium]|nr:hypothetical protein [Clostridiaceae bacterium]RKI12723.1 hypothetical protein D7V81_11615 [bacterium 1XD21-70]
MAYFRRTAGKGGLVWNGKILVADRGKAAIMEDSRIRIKKLSINRKKNRTEKTEKGTEQKKWINTEY